MLVLDTVLGLFTIVALFHYHHFFILLHDYIIPCYQLFSSPLISSTSFTLPNYFHSFLCLYILFYPNQNHHAFIQHNQLKMHSNGTMGGSANIHHDPPQHIFPQGEETNHNTSSTSYSVTGVDDVLRLLSEGCITPPPMMEDIPFRTGSKTQNQHKNQQDEEARTGPVKYGNRNKKKAKRGRKWQEKLKQKLEQTREKREKRKARMRTKTKDKKDEEKTKKLVATMNELAVED